MKVRTALAAAALVTLAFAQAPAQAASAPAIAEFNAAFANVKDCTYELRSHEIKGSQTQDRVYQYSFMKPNHAKTLIISGDGRGSGGVWSGGDTVSGHQGGILSGLHLNVGLHDPRAVSLRGYTIPDGLIQNVVDKYASAKGKLTQTSVTDHGQAVDMVELNDMDPGSNDGITRQQIFFNKSTHMPIREIRYAGNTAVVDDSFNSIKLNAGLSDKDF